MDGLVLKFPSNVEMDFTTQEYQRDSEKLMGQKILPVVEKATQKVEWDELDNDRGKTSAHVMGTDPKTKNRPGSKLKSYEPIPHKEGELVREPEILKARAFGTFGTSINLDDLVMEAFKRAMGKDDIAIEDEIWMALQGHLDISENGVEVHETFPVQIYEPDVPWDELATARPLADLDAVSQLFTGTGATGSGAIAIMNRDTLNTVYQNKNADDIKGYTVDNFRNATYSLEQLNKLLGDRKIPTLAEYDEGYQQDNNTWKKFIKTGNIVVIGKRPKGQNVGDYCTTPTLHRIKNGQPAAGRFAFVTVNGQASASGATAISLAQLGAHGNPKIEVIHGVYGGPRLLYPRSVVVIKAFEV